MADTVNEPGLAADQGVASGERRAQHRIQVLETSAGIVAVELDQGDSGIILDLTPEGMMVQCLAPLAAAETRTVSFVLPGTSSPLNLSAVVVWSDPEGRAGLRFNFAHDGTRKELQAWLADSRRSIFNASSGFFPPSVPESRPEPPPVVPAPSVRAPEPVLPSAPDPLQSFSLPSASPQFPEGLGEHQGAVNAMAWTIAEEISRLTPAHGAVVALIQGNTQQEDTPVTVITCRASWGSAPGVGARLQPEIGLSGECFRSGRVILCNDTDADERVPSSVSKRLNLKSILVVPVLGPRGTVGLLEALAGEKNAFSDSHVRILTRLATSLSEVLQGTEGTTQVVSPLPPPAPHKPAPKPVAASLLASPASRPPVPAAASEVARGNGAKPGDSRVARPAAPQPPPRVSPKPSPAGPAAKAPLLGPSARTSAPPFTKPSPRAADTPRPVASAFAGGAAAAAPRRTPAKTLPLPPLDSAPQAVQERQEEILPLAGALQADAPSPPGAKSWSSLPPLPRAAGASQDGALSGASPSDASPNRTFAMAGIGGLILLAVMAAGWTLSHRAVPASAQPASSAVSPQPADSAQSQATDEASAAPPLTSRLEASAGPATAPPVAAQAVVNSNGAERNGVAQKEVARKEDPPSPATASRIAPAKTRASEPPPPQHDISLDAVGEAIRRPAAVAEPLAGAGIASVRPPASLTASAAPGSGLSLPTEAAVPRLAAPPPPVPAQVLHRVEPSRPPGGFSGTVVLSAIIGTDGKPTDIKSVSGNPMLIAAAISAFRDWRYEPARRNGQAVTFPVQVRFIFRLQ